MVLIEPKIDQFLIKRALISQNHFSNLGGFPSHFKSHVGMRRINLVRFTFHTDLIFYIDHNNNLFFCTSLHDNLLIIYQPPGEA